MAKNLHPGTWFLWGKDPFFAARITLRQDTLLTLLCLSTWIPVWGKEESEDMGQTPLERSAFMSAEGDATEGSPVVSPFFCPMAVCAQAGVFDTKNSPVYKREQSPQTP